MPHVLFVCTGNIFRSLTAEYALRALSVGQDDLICSSAGIRDAPELSVRADVKDYLYSKGLDVSKHRRRTVSAEILQHADIIIAMSVDHQQSLTDRFQVGSTLFNQATGGQAVAMPDVDELFTPDQFYSPAAVEHVYATIDMIVARMPELLNNVLSDDWGCWD